MPSATYGHSCVCFRALVADVRLSNAAPRWWVLNTVYRGAELKPTQTVTIPSCNLSGLIEMEDASAIPSSADDPSDDIVSREGLYEQAWSKPMTKIAAQYGVSSSYLARVFTDLDVPRPPVGYWAKVAAGKGKARPALPPAKPGNRDAWSRNGAPARVAIPSEKTPAKSMGRRGRSRPILPDRHPVLIGIDEHFEKAKEGENGYLKPAKRAMADLIVSRTGVAHTVDVANQLYLALLSKGLTVTVGAPGAHMVRNEVDHREKPASRYFHPPLWQPDRATLVYIGAVTFA